MLTTFDRELSQIVYNINKIMLEVNILCYISIMAPKIFFWKAFAPIRKHLAEM